jgi:hypothetical protein
LADAIKISGRKKPNAPPINTDDFWGGRSERNGGEKIRGILKRNLLRK